MTIAHVVCKCCKGTGRIELTGCYAETLAVLRRQLARRTGADMARLMGCKNEAMCNRLKALERHGLAASERRGRELLWRAT